MYGTLLPCANKDKFGKINGWIYFQNKVFAAILPRLSSAIFVVSQRVLIVCFDVAGIYIWNRKFIFYKTSCKKNNIYQSIFQLYFDLNLSWKHKFNLYMFCVISTTFIHHMIQIISLEYTIWLVFVSEIFQLHSICSYCTLAFSQLVTGVDIKYSTNIVQRPVCPLFNSF